jgi:DNA-binding transcriptional MocR family regulator
MLDLAQYSIRGRTAREVAASVESSILEGVLETGDQLPTVRALAQALGTSPATVNSAYRTLRQRGLVIGEGRRGTRVAPRPALRAAARAWSMAPETAEGVRDLTVGLPDPELLPPVAPALGRVDPGRRLKLAGLEAPDPELVELAAKSFRADGLPADGIAVASGAFDAMERVLQAHLRPGDRVIVEDPTYGSIRDLLLALGLVEVEVAVDESGFRPQPFAAALAKGVDAIVVVPRAQNPIGAVLDRDRAQVLQDLLAAHRDLLVVADDHAALVAGAPFCSLIKPDWPKWAVIRSTSKVLHPDLRLAVLAGDETTIARVEGRQALGPRWVSHVLQALVVELMTDPGFAQVAAHARDVYAARRQALLSALDERGVEAYGRSGLNVWVPVREEATAVRALYEAGWSVMAGERFRIATPPGVRVTTARLRAGEAEEIAEVIARVEQSGRLRRVY